MRNKYMRRGVLMLIAGIGFNLLGLLIRREEWGLYGWAMIGGTILFGVGFVFILYSLIRKVERRSILEDRAAEQEKTDSVELNQNPSESA